MAVSADVTHLRGEQARRYWRDRLGRFDGPSRLGRGIPGPGSGPAPLEHLRLALSADGHQRLIKAGYGNPAARYPVVLAALALCLYRFSGQSRISFGALAPAGTGRGVVPILLAVSGTEPFCALVARVADELRLASQAGPAALDEVMTEFGLTAAPGTHPLFDVMCAATNLGDTDAGAPGRVRLIVTDDESGMTAVLSSDPRELEAAEARVVRHQLVRLLETAAEYPGLRVCDLCALSPEEYHTVVREWNGTATPDRAGHCVHHLFEDRVADQPGAIAVMTASGCYSYADLNRRANQLAHHLIDELGVLPGDLVAVAAERSYDVVVCALAVLKCGAAYLPVDPSHPAARTRMALEDARPAAVLTLSRHCDALPETAAAVLCADAENERIAARPGDNPGRPCTPDSLFCAIFTSGSTGRPKGLMLTHRAISNSLRWEQVAYQLTADDRLLQLASWSFSLAIVEAFSPLCAGATVVIAPPGAGRDTATVARLVGEYGVTILSVVPAELKLLLDRESAVPWTAIRRVITGADRLPRQVVDSYFEVCPSVPLLNIYGQTESAIDGLCWTCRPDDEGGRVPVGRPVSNVRAYILDADMQPVPVGVPGLLYCGGEGLARGYLGRPDLTAERFVPDPFAAVPGVRLSRTGDLARWRPDGVIELLGREDHQIQIAGTRVEVEEIEVVLGEHPDVRAAAVAVQAVPMPPSEPAPAGRPQWESLLAQVTPETVERHLAEAELGSVSTSVGDAARYSRSRQR